MITYILVFFTFFINKTTANYYEGDSCEIKKNGVSGNCTLLDNCPWAVEQIKRGNYPQICEFKGKIPVVCCPDDKAEIKGPGAKSEAFCKELSAFVFLAAIGGQKSLAMEFPHMAILGFGDENDKHWLCGGTLISFEYVLTAGHCIYSQEFGKVQWVRLGDLDLGSDSDIADPQDFSIKDIVMHPEYKPPTVYHDIALLKLNRKALRTPFVKPACLFRGGDIPPIELTATGWGATQFAGQSSSHLIKVKLVEVNHKQCKALYETTPPRRLPTGVIEEYQICAGSSDPEVARDTCQGDSGGPLQFESFETRKHFRIIGVTSFGKPCGSLGVPGLYTRVSNYLSWIEDNVWPD